MPSSREEGRTAMQRCDEPREEETNESWDDVESMNRHLAKYDVVILSAGADILRDRLVDGGERRLPVQLVRGQSIEITSLTTTTTDENGIPNEALLCGKYVSPLPSDDTTNNPSSSRRFVIGATHEFKDDPLNAEEVIDELKSRTYELAKSLWDSGTIDRVTSGVRLQTHRGRFGRMPIVGRYINNGADGVCHRNSWIFTGLSSRGLLYHGLFASWLANAVLHDDEEKLRDEFADFDWWRTI